MTLKTGITTALYGMLASSLCVTSPVVQAVDFVETTTRSTSEYFGVAEQEFQNLLGLGPEYNIDNLLAEFKQGTGAVFRDNPEELEILLDMIGGLASNGGVAGDLAMDVIHGVVDFMK